MKATLKFNLPEEDSELEAAVKSMDMGIFLWDLDEWIRNKLNHTTLKPNQLELIDELNEFVMENRPNLEKWR